MKAPFSPIKSSISNQDLLPETLEVEGEDIEKIRSLLKALVESATMIIKAKSFLGANQMKLKAADFKKMHAFLHEMNEDNEIKEEVSPYGEDGKYSLLTISDPNSDKGRKRLSRLRRLLRRHMKGTLLKLVSGRSSLIRREQLW